MPNLLHQPVPHEEGAAYIRNKPAVTRAVFDRLAPELQARAFVITGIESLDVAARVRETLAELPVGGDFRELKEKIFQELSPWLVTSTDAEEREKQLGAARRRAELLLRMHGWQAYARTQHALMEEHIDVFPYRQYLSSEDGRVRPHHEALNRKILPADHPFWDNHTPPWEFSCRCDCVPLTEDEVGEIRAAEKSKPAEDQQVLGEAQLREIEQNQRIVKPGGQGFLDIRTPREREGRGYEWRPGEDALDIDQILSRFTSGERRMFEDFAARQRLEDGRTLLDWWKSGAAPTPASPPTPTPPAPAPAPTPQTPTPKVPKARKAAAKKAGKRRRLTAAERMRAKISGAVYRTETSLGGGVNTTVRLRNGVEVVFKPASGEYAGALRPGIRPGEQYKREKAASLIDQHLGTDLVPPTEIITWKGEVGSAQLFRGGWSTAHERRLNLKPVSFDADTERRMSLLDEVLGHLDRHTGNLMVRKRPKGGGIDNVIMIDNGLALSSEAYGSGTRFPVPLAGKPLDAASRRQVDDFLARRSEWEPEVESLVGRQAVRHMLDRIDRLKTRGFGHIAPCF